MKTNSLSNKSIISIFIAMVVIAFGLWIAVYQLSKPKTVLDNNYVSNMTNNQLDGLLVNAGYSEADIKDMTNNEKEQALLTNNDTRYAEATVIYNSFNANASEYPEAESITSYRLALSFFEEYKYGVVSTQVKEILQKYKLTTALNIKLGNIMGDALIAINYDNLSWSSKEMSLKVFKNPDSFLLGVLNAYPRRREVVIADLNSLSPVSMSYPSITKTTLLEKTSAEYISNAIYMNDVRNIYRIDFGYGEFDTLYAYVLESNDRVLRLSGIYSDKQYAHARTVAWWIDTNEDIEKEAE